MKRIRHLRSFTLFQKIVALMLTLSIPLVTMPEAALALPHGGVVSKGQATLGYSTGKLLITQTTSSATFNWGSFNVKSGQSVVYKTPGASSVSLNYIGGTTPSSIDGSVTSNGILEFMNPNGLIFGSGSVVSAAGVMAFGSSTPWGKPTGTVTNAGTITSANNGTVALVGSSVTNSGTLTAPGGEVLLAAGSTVTPIATAGGSSFSVATTGGGLVDDSGIVSAETVGGKTGTILLQSGMDSGTTTLESPAVLDVSAPNGGNGGAITVNGYKVVLDELAPLNVSAPSGIPGTITIDPTVTDVGTASALETIDSSQSTYLDNSSVYIALTANIDLGGYSWTPLGTNSSPFIGTFNGNGYMVSGYTIGTSTTPYAGNDVGFIGYLGSGGVVKNLGVSGTIFASVPNGSPGNYVGGVVGYNNGGTVETSYNTGNVSGTGMGNVGGVVGGSNGTVEYSYNTGTITDGSSGSSAGGVVAFNNGTVGYSYNTGNVSGFGYVGGVVGANVYLAEYSYNTGVISSNSNGVNYIGGIAGGNGGTTQNSYNLGSVTGTGYDDVGGIAGTNTGTINNAYYNTSVAYGSGSAGYNAGTNNSSGISQSEFGTASNVSNLGTFNTWSSGAFQSSAISAPWFEGSVASGSGPISAPMLVPDLPTATVTGNSGTSVYSGSTVSPGYTTTYTMGASALPSGITVTAPAAFGPNAGSYTVTPTVSGTISAPTTQTSVDSVSAASGAWTITALPVTATATPATMTYGGTVPTLSGTFSTTAQQTGGLSNLSASWATPATSASNAGSYAVIPSYSYANGAVAGDYTITAASGNATALTITPAPLTFSGSVSNPTKVYDGTTTATLTTSNSSATLSGFVNGQGATYTGATGSYSTANAGTGIPVSATLGTGDFSSSGSGFSWSNYTLPSMALSGTGTILSAISPPNPVLPSSPSSPAAPAKKVASAQHQRVLQTVDLYVEIPVFFVPPGTGGSGSSFVDLSSTENDLKK